MKTLVFSLLSIGAANVYAHPCPNYDAVNAAPLGLGLMMLAVLMTTALSTRINKRAPIEEKNVESNVNSKPLNSKIKTVSEAE